MISEGRGGKNKIPKTEHDSIKTLYVSGGINKRQLAFKYGVHPTSMGKLLKKLGI